MRLIDGGIGWKSSILIPQGISSCLHKYSTPAGTIQLAAACVCPFGGGQIGQRVPGVPPPMGALAITQPRIGQEQGVVNLRPGIIAPRRAGAHLHSADDLLRNDFGLKEITAVPGWLLAQRFALALFYLTYAQRETR